MRAAHQRRVLALALASLLAAAPVQAALDTRSAAAGLKEALQNGARRAAEELGREDGFLGREDVRIPVPEEIESLASTLQRIGAGRIIEDLVTSMNRAAEQAVPVAREIFGEAIREMSIEDAVGMVRGSDRAATDYLMKHAGPRLAERFQPIVSDKLAEVGATRALARIADRASRLPFIDEPVLDLDSYVTTRALDGLFLVVAQEEKRIRDDPAARTTDLLKTVFGAEGKEDGQRPWWKRVFGR